MVFLEYPGEFLYDGSTGEYVIRIESTNSIGVLSHELEHSNQLENGELYLDNSGIIQGYDINDEVDAYTVQHVVDQCIFDNLFDLNGYPVPSEDYEITPQEIYDQFPGMYDELEGYNNNEPTDSTSATNSHP